LPALTSCKDKQGRGGREERRKGRGRREEGKRGARKTGSIADKGEIGGLI